MDCYEEMRCEFVNWFQLGSDTVNLRAFVNMVV